MGGYLIKTIYFEKVTDITPQMLSELKVKTIFLDVDNTIRYTGSSKLLYGIEQWINQMLINNVNIILLSNNFKNHSQNIASQLNLKCIYFSLKPSPFGYFRAKLRFKISFKYSVVIGDQIFTDILGAKICRIKSILVNPLDISKEKKTVAFRRLLCNKIHNNIVSQSNPLLNKKE